MGEHTKIEWADHTFNPWIGCTKVSAGCAHCYAETMMDKRLGRAQWGPGQPRVHTSAANWATPIAWNDQARAEGRRLRVFCASLADVFDPEVPTMWRVDLLQLIDDTPHLDWLLLTKRPELVAGLLGAASNGNMVDFRHMPNIWLGTSVEDQAAADVRIPVLLSIQAKVRFLSMEPLLGAVDLEDFYVGRADGNVDSCLTRIHWVIVGGESGPAARPMHPQWARDVRDQCNAAGVAFLFKQWGEHIPQDHAHVLDDDAQVRILNGDMPGAIVCETAPPLLANGGGDPSFSTRIMPTYKVGKHAAGRLLDGRTWDEVPDV